MKKSIAENCIRYISTATALILALAMLCCANFSAGAKTLGSNLSITDTTSLLEDINTATNTTPAKTKDLIASGASVELLSTGISGTYYLDLSDNYSNWEQDNARFAVCTYTNGSNHTWYDMEKVSGKEHIYQATINDSNVNINFVRMKQGTTENKWDNKLYETGDLTPESGKNCYKLNANTWDKGNGTWSTYEEKTIYFDNSKTNWDSVNIYCWDTKNNNASNANFPGVAMKKVEGTDNIYSYTYSTSYTNCIFSKGSDRNNKIGDLTIPTDGNNYYYNGSNWSTYPVTDPSNPVVTDDNLKSVLKGEQVMVYAGEPWEQSYYYFMSNNNISDKVATADITKFDKTINDTNYNLGVATLPPGNYFQGHWESGLEGRVEAGGTYIVRKSTTATGFTQLDVNDKEDYLYSYDAGSTKTATTTIGTPVNVGGKLSVSTSTQPGKSSLGKDNRFKYYLYDGTNYTEVSLTNGKVDTSELPEGNNYQLITVLYDGNIYVRADADRFEIKQDQVNLADSVTLTSAPETVEQNTALTLTATLENKNANAGSVKYTFTNESDLGGTFENGNSEVTTTETSASVKFTPTAAGTYTFKVVASCDGYKQVENTVVVTVVDEVKYYITGRFMGKSWKDNYTDMQLTKDSDGIYKYATGKTVAELSEKIKESGDGDKLYDPYFYIRIGDNKSNGWYGGINSTGQTFDQNTNINKFELDYKKGTDDTGSSKLLKFADTTATTKQDVVICLDTRDSSHYKLWYEYTTPTEYDITYDNDGKGTITGPDKAYADANVTGFTVIPKKGYLLDKLTYNKTEFTSESGFTMPAQNVTVKATFKPKTYSITYRINSEVDNTLTPKTYHIESTEAERTLPVPPSRDGYTFSGWHSVDGGEGDSVEVIPSDTTGNLNYYGNYDPIQYTVTFDPGDGELAPEDRTKQVYYNATYGDLPTPTKPNYSFIGWYLGKEPDDVQITKDSEYNTVGDVVLKAKYAAKPTITVNIAYKNTNGSDKATVEGTGEKDYNSSGQVTVTPNPGYYISNVKIEEIRYNYNAASDPWTYKYEELKHNLTITVTLTDNPKVTVEVYYNDEIATEKATVKINNVVQSSANIKYGDSAAFVVTSASGYYISSVKLKDDTYSPKSGEWTHTIQHVEEDKNIEVYLSANPKVVVKCVDARNEQVEIPDDFVSATVKPASSTESSTVSSISVEYGSSVALVASVIKENSYQFNGFYKLDGTSLSTSASYTYENVTADTTILAKFDKLYEITIKWEKLDGLSLKIGEETTDLQNVSSPYKKYMTQGATFNLTTTINVKSEYKLNESCFVSSGLNGSYSVAREDEDKVTTKHYSCTVLDSDGTITISPKPATYSGSGYWGDKVLKIDTTGVMKDSPNFSVLFSKEGSENTIEVRMVCTNSTNNIYECPIPNGYTSFVLKRRDPSKWSKEWNTASATLNGNTEFTASFVSGTGMVLEPKSGT